MRRDTVLAAARADCLQRFASQLEGLPKRGADKAFAMAYKTTNFTEHRLFLDAFSALNNRAAVIEKQLCDNLSVLLGRSIQTAYNPRRAAAVLEAGADDWSLVDATAIDAEIRLQKISSLFHARSGEDIRTLNMRIASLFDQDMVKERENPFRPYLFSRCIFDAISDLRLPPDVTEVVVEQIALEMVDGVAGIYQALNSYFESQGVAARLIVKVSSSSAVTAASGPREHDGGHENVPDLFGHIGGVPNSIQTGGDAALRGAQAMAGAQAFPSGPHQPYLERVPRMAKLEKLLRVVRKKASQPGASSEHLDAIASLDGEISEGRATGIPDGVESNSLSGGVHGPAIFGDGWIDSGQIARERLQSLFTARVDGVAAASGANAIASGSSAAVSLLRTPVYHHLQQIYVPSLGELVDSAGEVRNLIFESRAKLQSKASGIDEMMTIDVVGMIFEFILRDLQVPAEIRAQLGRLQFHMLKIALVDMQLLSQKEHPARRLINRIGTVSTGLKPNDAFMQQFTAEVQRIVEAMLADETGNIELVSKLSSEFEAFVARHLRSSNAKVENAVEAIEVAERRSAYFSRLKTELGRIFATVQADPYLKDFIENAWLSAIEKAEHQDAQLGRRYRALVPEILWSVLGKPNERERSRLLTHLPQMLFDLKAGLGAIRFQERQTFLSWLVESHTAAIKGTGYRPDQPSLSVLRKHFQSFTDLTSQEAVTAPAGDAFDRRFIRDAAEEMSLRLDEIETIMEFGKRAEEPETAEQSALSQATDATSFAADEVLSRLRIGVPVEVNVDGAPRKATLNWLNASVTNMVLTFENKETPTTISVSLFRRLLANERARFVEAAPLFERAVSALLDAADTVDGFFN